MTIWIGIPGGPARCVPPGISDDEETTSPDPADDDDDYEVGDLIIGGDTPLDDDDCGADCGG